MTYTGITGTVFGSAPLSEPGVICGANIDVSGVLPPGQIGNCFSLDGQLLIGRTIKGSGGTHVAIGNITSTDGSITVTNGAGTIDLSNSSAAFEPNNVVQIFDEFFANNAGSDLGELRWEFNGSPSYIATITDHPGIVELVASASKSYARLTNSSFSDHGFLLTSGATNCSFNGNLQTLSDVANRYEAVIGLTDDGNTAVNAIANGCYFSYSDNVNSGNWVLNCMKASVATTSNTSIAADTSYHTFSVVSNAGATSVGFYIDNLLVGTIATNIPNGSTNIFPTWQLTRSSGNTAASTIDLFYLTQALNNPRPGPSGGTIPSNFRFFGNYTQTATNYQVLGTDAIVGISSTAAARTITMPSSGVEAGQWFRIKDESGGAGTNNITINGNGFLIDGAATYVINTNYGSVDIYFNGSAYYLS